MPTQRLSERYREGAKLAIAGITVGLVIALSLTHVMQSLLFEVAATDAGTYAVIVLFLGVAVLLASLVPARRAAKIDPMIAMRNG